MGVIQNSGTPTDPTGLHPRDPVPGLIRPVGLEDNWQFILQILDERGDGGKVLGASSEKRRRDWGFWNGRATRTLELRKMMVIF